MRNLLRRFISDTRGNFAIMGAGCMVLVLGCAALGVDVGSIYADRRKAQSAADLAAIVAAGNLGKATSAAAATVMANGYPTNALLSVELGTFTANAALAPQARFVTPATGAPNAARVTLRTETPLYFARMFTGGSSHFDITSRATAASTALASFAIGSRLVSLNGGLLNAILGQMLGTTLSLSAMDYQSLIDAHIDAFDFINALATRLDLTGVTYDSVLSGDVKVGDMVAAMLSAQQAANGMNAATTALSKVSLALAGLTTTIVPGKLIDVGPYAAMTVGSKPKTGVSVSAFDLLSATGAIANGSNQIAASVNLGLPGIASVSVMATIGERPQGTSWMTVGTEGASVHTAQTRVLVSIKLLGSGPVAAVNLPVYIEVASGTATLTAVSCGRPDISTSSVTLGVTPGIVDAWIGNVSAAEMTNFTSKPDPGAAMLVNLGAVTVTGRAHAGMGNTAPTPVSFSYADIAAQTKKTVTTTDFTSSLTASLLGDLSLKINVGPLGLPVPGLGPAVTGIISGATASIDQVLAQVLATLGVGIGQADVWVSGIRCDGAVLVN
ncbi:pilus assembly protein TadG-related protein [Nitrobacter vulgaris]|uniref:pilus assembly protein TadG-related protein n=1 Tax=Nitrobacter vulgaris TaxID=29421 RepID=UPI00286D0A68|nr:pilus assembly protein TadG-related protein [Nitrobacter vulgaris]